MNKNFYLLLQGTIASNIGNVLYSIAIGIWVFNKTGSTALMGLMSSITYLMSFALSPFAGVVADRFNRKWILVLTDAVRGVTMIVIAILAFNNHLEVAHVLIVAVIAALCNVAFEPSSSSLVITLVEKSKILKAQSMMQGSSSLVSLVGNAVSGFLIIAFGVPLMIAINGLSFIVSSLTEIFIKVPGENKKEIDKNSFNVFSDIKDGIQYVLKNKGLMPLIVSTGLMNLTQAGLGAILYPWTQAKGMSVTEYGLFMGIEGGAAFLATLILSIKNIKGNFRKKLFIFATITTVVFNITTMLCRGFLACTIFNSVAAFSGVILNMILMAGLYIIIAEEHRGKVIGLILSLSRGGVALSMLLYGAASEIAGVELVAIIGAIGFIVPTVIFLKNPLLNKMVAEG